MENFPKSIKIEKRELSKSKIYEKYFIQMYNHTFDVVAL